MTTPVFTQAPREEDVLVSEANGSRSRDVISITSTSVDLAPGTPIGSTTTSAGTTFQTWAPGHPLVGLNLRTVEAGETEAVSVVRAAEVRDSAIIWPAAATDPQIAAGRASLATNGVIVR